MPEESSSLHHAPPCELTGTLGAIIPQTNGLLPCETFALATAFGKWPPLKLMCGYAYAAVSALAGGKGRLSCEWKGYEAPEYGRDWAGGKPGRKCTGPNNKAFLRSCGNFTALHTASHVRMYKFVCGQDPEQTAVILLFFVRCDQRQFCSTKARYRFVFLIKKYFRDGEKSREKMGRIK